MQILDTARAAKWAKDQVGGVQVPPLGKVRWPTGEECQRTKGGGVQVPPSRWLVVDQVTGEGGGTFSCFRWGGSEFLALSWRSNVMQTRSLCHTLAQVPTHEPAWLAGSLSPCKRPAPEQ